MWSLSPILLKVNKARYSHAGSESIQCGPFTLRLSVSKERQIDRVKERQIQRNRKRNREKGEREREREREKERERETDWLTDWLTDRLTDWLTDRLADRQAGRQEGRQTGRQAERDRQAERERQTERDIQSREGDRDWHRGTERENKTKIHTLGCSTRDGVYADASFKIKYKLIVEQDLSSHWEILVVIGGWGPQVPLGRERERERERDMIDLEPPNPHKRIRTGGRELPFFSCLGFFVATQNGAMLIMA